MADCIPPDICIYCGDLTRARNDGLVVHVTNGRHRCDGLVGRKFGKTDRVAHAVGDIPCDCWTCTYD